MKFGMTLIGAVVLGLGMQANATTVPNTFTSGQAASASAVNANFNALATAIDAVGGVVNSLTARVAKLEGSQNISINDLLGTYNLMMLKNELGTAHVQVRQTVGTVVLSSDNNTNNVAYTATLTCSANSGEESQPNATYGNPGGSSEPFITTLISGCTGVLGATVNWTFDTASKMVNFTGTNVLLMPVGPGLLIGRDATTDTNAGITNTGVTLFILVRKQ